MFDLLIKDGLVIDGSGGPARQADLGIKGPVIAEIGRLDRAGARRVIEAEGRAVSPGFIDMHSHTDFSLPVLPTADSLLHQGITTAVVGQCGLSPAPLLDETRAEVIDYNTSFLADQGSDVPWEEWSSFGEYLAFLERTGISLNAAALVGQGAIRGAVMGFASGPASPEQMARMQAEAARAMDEGAFGLSTGLVYPPGSFALEEELIELTRVVGRRGGLYFSHIRGEGETLLEAVTEAINIGRASGARVQISHFKASGRSNWDKSAQALALIDRARVEGLEVGVDMYPYLAGSTHVPALLPEWAHQGGAEALLRRLAEPAQREKMSREMDRGGLGRGIGWESIVINGSPRRPEYQGRSLAELAAAAGKTAPEWVFDALLEARLELRMIMFAMSEENRRLELSHPAMTIGTDGRGLTAEGLRARGKPHPRSFGTFPRILGRYVREQGVLSLEEAVHKMTGLAAGRLGLADRGLIRPGLAADLVVFDPATVLDLATYEEPFRYPAGLFHVMVNGEPVISDAIHTGARPGRVLRPL